MVHVFYAPSEQTRIGIFHSREQVSFFPSGSYYRDSGFEFLHDGKHWRLAGSAGRIGTEGFLSGHLSAVGFSAYRRIGDRVRAGGEIRTYSSPASALTEYTIGAVFDLSPHAEIYFNSTSRRVRGISSRVVAMGLRMNMGPNAARLLRARHAMTGFLLFAPR